MKYRSRWTVQALGVVMGIAAAQAGANQSVQLNGADLYESYCGACHGYDGTPLLPNVPNFANGERLEKPDGELLNSIRAGKGKTMPSWLGILDDEDCENVLEFIRTGINSPMDTNP